MRAGGNTEKPRSGKIEMEIIIVRLYLLQLLSLTPFVRNKCIENVELMPAPPEFHFGIGFGGQIYLQKFTKMCKYPCRNQITNTAVKLNKPHI